MRKLSTIHIQIKVNEMAVVVHGLSFIDFKEDVRKRRTKKKKRLIRLFISFCVHMCPSFSSSAFVYNFQITLL